ncbi:putative vacuolar (H+)-ATPase subunit e isoform B [Teratosphaeria destructans]|uniref:Vacuolar (H+)-ATPase subunit e isoform B n=1 Tax=Teratosphaeria destructans TaxID=418781 RepID=A0A9W7W039_9PEZI|nr:putative vacuolar (H+)-ATPase subunit e isoform B [Teratosphaeria destructans]
MANGWSILISIIFIAAFSAVSWFASPKGENQTVWRSTLILSAWSCWLMWGKWMEAAGAQDDLEGHVGGRMWKTRDRVLTWRHTAITFLAQWHPLIVPERNDLRPEYANGPVKPSGRFF